MDISKLIISAQHRNAWSAIDLGFLLARENYFQLMLSWMLISLPLVLLSLLLPHDYMFLAILLIWWLKPFWDRGPLYIISKALFDEKVSWSELIQTYPALMKNNALAWLSYKRFTITRSYVQPVILLEGLKAQDLSKRNNSLRYGTGSAPAWLTIVCIHLEMIIAMGIYGLIVMLIPQEANIDYWKMLENNSASTAYLSTIISFLAMALIAPFYVCAGFMLYINQRILLEGWDIEIEFRLLAARLKAQQENQAYPPQTNTETRIANNKASRSRSSTLASLLAAGLMLSFALSSLQATPALAEPDDLLDSYKQPSKNTTSSTPETVAIENSDQAQHLIQAVLKGEDFVNKKQVKRFRLIDETKKDESEEDDSWLVQQLKDLRQWINDYLKNKNTDHDAGDTAFGISQVIEVLIWLALASILIYIAILGLNWYRTFIPSTAKSGKRSAAAKPDMLFGFDMKQKYNVREVENKARTLWQQQEYRSALALIYAAMLSKLIHDFKLDLHEGYTEQECVELLNASIQSEHQPLKPFVKQLTASWLQVAYAHQQPEPQLGKHLWQQWSELFTDAG